MSLEINNFLIYLVVWTYF